MTATLQISCGIRAALGLWAWENTAWTGDSGVPWSEVCGQHRCTPQCSWEAHTDQPHTRDCPVFLHADFHVLPSGNRPSDTLGLCTPPPEKLEYGNRIGKDRKGTFPKVSETASLQTVRERLMDPDCRAWLAATAATLPRPGMGEDPSARTSTPLITQDKVRLGRPS